MGAEVRKWGRRLIEVSVVLSLAQVCVCVCVCLWVRVHARGDGWVCVRMRASACGRVCKSHLPFLLPLLSSEPHLLPSSALPPALSSTRIYPHPHTHSLTVSRLSLSFSLSLSLSFPPSLLISLTDGDAEARNKQAEGGAVGRGSKRKGSVQEGSVQEGGLSGVSGDVSGMSKVSACRDPPSASKKRKVCVCWCVCWCVC